MRYNILQSSNLGGIYEEESNYSAFVRNDRHGMHEWHESGRKSGAGESSYRESDCSTGCRKDG